MLCTNTQNLAGSLARLAAAARRPLTVAGAALLVAGGLVTASPAAVRHASAASTFDQTLFTLINQDRAQNGVGPLRWNSTIAAVAEGGDEACAATVGGRAQDMIARGYFSHSIPGCPSGGVFGVMSRLGIGFSSAGENIGWESGVTDQVQAAQMLNNDYMNSPEHRANILNPDYTDVGVGGWSTQAGQTWSGGGGSFGSVTMSVEDFATNPTVPAPAVASVPPSVNGYWLVGGDGATFDFGAPGDFGSLRGQYLNQAVVASAATPDGHGYWMVARDGGVFTFGDAAGYGSTGGRHLNQPIVGMAATPSGHGYWLVASDGGLFPFGDARFHSYGSTGGIHLNQPIVGMARTASGNGYWLVARDGGIFPFGDARGHSYGSTGGMTLNQPIVGMTPTHTGNGYFLVAADGGVFTFGDARGLGSTGGYRLNAPIVGMTLG